MSDSMDQFLLCGLLFWSPFEWDVFTEELGDWCGDLRKLRDKHPMITDDANKASGAFEVLDVPWPVAKSCDLGWVDGSSFA